MNTRPFLLLSAIVLVLVQILTYVSVKLIFKTPPIPVLEEVCWGRESSCRDGDVSIRPFIVNVSKEVIIEIHIKI